MANNDRDEDGTPPVKGSRRRRRPPVLELEATEVGAESKKGRTEKPKSRARAAGSDTRKDSGAWQQFRDRAAAINWPRPSLPVALAGGVGLLAGAAVVFAAFLLFGRGADPRLAPLGEEVAALSARIEMLAKQPPSAAVPDTDALGERIDRLTAAITESEKRLAAIEDRPLPQPDLSAFDERSAAIEAALQDLRTTLAEVRQLAEQTPSPATPEALDALGGRIGALEERISLLLAARPPVPEPSLAAEIAALHALADAIESGRPFPTELDAVRMLMGERAEPLAALAPHAETGLPTVAALAGQFSELAPAMVRGPEPEGDFLTRFFAQAQRLVEVRPVGEPEGTDVGAVVARMEARLARGDLQGALAEAGLLPDHARLTAAGWIATATQRRDAELAVKGMIESTLAVYAERTEP